MRNKRTDFIENDPCVQQGDIHIFNNTFYCQTLTSVADGQREVRYGTKVTRMGRHAASGLWGGGKYGDGEGKRGLLSFVLNPWE